MDQMRNAHEVGGKKLKRNWPLTYTELSWLHLAPHGGRLSTRPKWGVGTANAALLTMAGTSPCSQQQSRRIPWVPLERKLKNIAGSHPDMKLMVDH